MGNRISWWARIFFGVVTISNLVLVCIFLDFIPCLTPFVQIENGLTKCQCVLSDDDIVIVRPECKKIEQSYFAGNQNIKFMVFLGNKTELTERAFIYCKNLNHVVLSSECKKIPAFAFAFCENLKDIWLPRTISNIGKGAFAGCSDLKIRFTGNIEKLNLSADSFCGAENILFFDAKQRKLKAPDLCKLFKVENIADLDFLSKEHLQEESVQ